MDFGKLVNKAKDLAGKHPDQIHKGVDKVEELAHEKTGGQYDSQIETAGNAAERYLDGQNQPGQEGREQGQQDQGQNEQNQQG
ncbi:MAG TPA: antitoxin [Trebonia sp.]|jgi:hypothetical protein